MDVYYLHLRGGEDEVIDEEGMSYASLAELREMVLVCAREVLCADIRDGVLDLRGRIDAEDDAGVVVHSLQLIDSVRLRGDDAEKIST